MGKLLESIGRSISETLVVVWLTGSAVHSIRFLAPLLARSQLFIHLRKLAGVDLCEPSSPVVDLSPFLEFEYVAILAASAILDLMIVSPTFYAPFFLLSLLNAFFWYPCMFFGVFLFCVCRF